MFYCFTTFEEVQFDSAKRIPELEFSVNCLDVQITFVDIAHLEKRYLEFLVPKQKKNTKTKNPKSYCLTFSNKLAVIKKKKM